jgi:putative membrane protein insertion efficiency factor
MDSSKTAAHQLLVFFATAVHRLYKITLSPLFGNACRHTPYCSDYALQAIEEHGFWSGSWLAVKRVARCHPWHAGGSDPVPRKRDLSQNKA